MKEIHDELLQASRGNAEFSAKDVHLPEYDEDAIELLFGQVTDDNVPLKAEPGLAKAAVERLCEFNRLFAEKITEILGAAQLLLNDYNEMMDYIKKGRA